MKVTDYIVEFFIKRNVTDIFGYPGGVICHLIDSVTKYPEKIRAHINYHEQASAFAACGYAQESGNIGVAFTTSGPGATNLVTGVANAYFDSIPTMFLTGQVDTYGLKGNLPIRQRGFQETDVVAMLSSVTKYAVRIDDPNDIRFELEKAYYIAKGGNPGPVVLDLPADVQRAEINADELKGFLIPARQQVSTKDLEKVYEALKAANRPCLLVGNGVKQAGQAESLRKLIERIKIPTVFSMPAFDTLPYNNIYNYGFIGANGQRYGNFVLGKADLIISIGSRLDLKQVGNNRAAFAPKAKLIRIDIDETSFSYPVHQDETQIVADIKTFLPQFYQIAEKDLVCTQEWNNVCQNIKSELEGFDDKAYTILLKRFGQSVVDNCSITADVGQSGVWIAQHFQVKANQKVHMSAGHGAMGFSLPAAIGTYYANKRPVYCFNGDGGIQMNIQELQFLAREKIPVHVVILNNHALGMIRGFQEANFSRNYALTVEGMGYSAPDFSKLADAYGLQYAVIQKENDVLSQNIDISKPSVIEIDIPAETSLNPNFGKTGLIQDQLPYIKRDLFDRLMKL